MTEYWIGTAGWSYQDWEGVVYPRNKEAGFHALAFLSQYINFMEINSSFYRPPVMKTTLSWVKRVAGRRDFLFAVKIHQNFTHKRGRIDPAEVDAFKIGIEPLAAHHRLAALLIQFPWSFRNTQENLDYLSGLIRLFSDYSLAVEFRHSGWLHPDILQFLVQNRIAFCNIDQPVIGDSIPPTAHRTHPEFSYVRLHGRNAKNWFQREAGRDARYDYLYSESELDEWVDKIKRLGEKSPRIYVVTNNHYQGQALTNALQIRNKITGEELDIPKDLLARFPVLKKIIGRIRKGQLDLFEG